MTTSSSSSISVSLKPVDAVYPQPLLEALGLKAPTLQLRGALPQTRVALAVVGTRTPTREARTFARLLGRELAEQGIVVYSGGARGIDAAVHEGALEAGAPTVLVAGAGLHTPYPPEHAELYDRIVAGGGALLTHLPDEAPPLPRHFLQRNLVLAALTLGTVVVEAGLRSGARSTAAAARRLGRALLVVPQAPWAPEGAGCAAELSRGATAVTCADDVLRACGLPAKRRAPGTPRALPRSGRREPCQLALVPHTEGPARREKGSGAGPEGQVLAALGAGPRTFDQLTELTDLPAPALQSALLTLTLDLVVVQDATGSYRRTSTK